MKLILRFGFFSLLVLGASIIEVGPPMNLERGLVTTADAIVGRPLTPVSVAGVARRSSRRCASGMTCK
jgi:hypothetical protein